MGKGKIFMAVFGYILFISLTTWASEIDLPRTGQTKCYDSAGSVIACAGTGQDGNIQAGVPWPSPRFAITYCDASGPCKDQGSDCDGNALTDLVTDRLTGLIWSRNGNQGLKLWADALVYANGFTLCGYSDWRLPNVNELISLMSLPGEAASYTYLNSHGFVGFDNNATWSSTTASSNHQTAFTVSYGISVSSWASGEYASPRATLPVRGGQSGAPDPSFPANVWKTGQTVSYAPGDDGDLRMGVDWPNPRFKVGAGADGDCVTDNLTGLMWSKNTDLVPGATTWQGALDFIFSLNSGAGLCGHHDWRLPNAFENASLADYSYDNPSLPAGNPFPNGNAYHWSSTTWAYDTTSSMGGNTPYGGICWFPKSDDIYNRVWAVRLGKIWPSIVSLRPSSVTSAANKAKAFAAVYTDRNGPGNLKAVEFLVSPGTSAVNGIRTKYNRGLNKLYLYDDAGKALLPTTCTPGAAGTITNTQGTLNCAATTVSVSGNNLKVNWNIKPKAAFASATPRNLRMLAVDKGGLNSGWVTKGTWTIQ